eukprot:1085725-Prorocentrum_minimum.AAC.1
MLFPRGGVASEFFGFLACTRTDPLPLTHHRLPLRSTVSPYWPPLTAAMIPSASPNNRTSLTVGCGDRCVCGRPPLDGGGAGGLAATLVALAQFRPDGCTSEDGGEAAEAVQGFSRVLGLAATRPRCYGVPRGETCHPGFETHILELDHVSLSPGVTSVFPGARWRRGCCWQLRWQGYGR